MRARSLLVALAACAACRGTGVEYGEPLPVTGAWSPVCPNDQPAPGTPCTAQQARVICEYSNTERAACGDATVACVRGEWVPNGAMCLPPPGANPPACPSSFPASIAVTACPASGPPFTCIYPEGLCDCGYEMLVSTQTWSCYREPGCLPRPRLGAACDGADRAPTSCTYQTCDYVQGCVDGYWQQNLGGC
jgi:hypothetical protein